MFILSHLVLSIFTFIVRNDWLLCMLGEVQSGSEAEGAAQVLSAVC